MKQKRWGKRRHGKVLLPRIVGDFGSHLQAVVPEHDNVMTVVGNTNSRKPYTAAATVGAANATDTVTTKQHRPQFLHLLLLPQVSVDVAVPISAAVILVCSTDHVRTRCGCC